MRKTYDSLIMKVPIEYDYIFKDLEKIDYQSLFTAKSRDFIIRLAVTLNNLYCNEPASTILHLLSSSAMKQDLNIRLISFMESEKLKSVEYVVCFDTLPIEILRLAFSIPYEKYHGVQNVANEEFEYQMVQLITQINEKSAKYTIPKNQQGDLPILIYTNSASNYDILHFNQQNEFIYQLAQAILFFKSIESKTKYNDLLQNFYTKFNISHWREYVRTIYSIAIISMRNAGFIPSNLDKIDPDHLINPSILDEISIPHDINVISYACKNEYDKIGNSDYKILREKPLVKLANGDWAIYSNAFVIDRLYCSLYFDFKNIRKTLIGRQPYISNLFTSEFIEKELLCGLLKEHTDERMYISKNEEGLKEIHTIEQRELGYPDYYIENKKVNSAILFECKDIKLNAWIKEQRDFGLYEKELKNKLVEKTYQLDYSNECHKLIDSQRVGCGQIAGHVSNIRKGTFPWSNTLKADSTIYPVLVIADNRLLADGLANLLQRWYYECLIKESVDATDEKPLIVMSPITLIKYGERFRRDGLEVYFEEYYQSILQQPQDYVSALNTITSFDSYMSKYAFNLKEYGESIVNELTAND